MDEAQLTAAAGRGDVEEVRRLLDAGADVNAQTEWDRTPLHVGEPPVVVTVMTSTSKLHDGVIDSGGAIAVSDK